MKPAAIGIIFRNNNSEVLIVQRRDVPVWVLPGGGIDEGETPEQAVVRELKEETGLLVTVTRKTGCYLPANPFTSTAHVYECEVISGDLTQSDETRHVRYAPMQQLPTHFFAYHREWLDDALNYSKTVRKQMSNGTFLSILLFYTLRPIWGMKYLWSRWVASGK